MHRDEGVIFISIDENEIETLKMVCNEIFGKNKHIATIARQKRYSRENQNEAPKAWKLKGFESEAIKEWFDSRSTEAKRKHC